MLYIMEELRELLEDRNGWVLAYAKAAGVLREIAVVLEAYDAQKMRPEDVVEILKEALGRV